MSEISIWVAPASHEVSKGVLGRGTEAMLKKIDPAQLNASLKALARDLDQVLSDVETTGGFHLSGVEVGVEVTAEAGFNLVGTGTVGGKAGLTLRFEKG